MLNEPGNLSWNYCWNISFFKHHLKVGLKIN